MTKLMLLGDIHGNLKFFTQEVVPAAVSAGVQWIYQVGDFGYWEHTNDGKLFLDDINNVLVENSLSIVTVQGNHDKISLVRRYPTVDDFYLVRPAIWHADNGTVWSFEGTTFLALGGAYSIDKNDRVAQEENKISRNAEDYLRNNRNFSREYATNRARALIEETLWFPEEEMTDSEVEEILSSLAGTKVDVILAHDKPVSSNPMIKLLDIAECLPNQRRLQKAVTTLQPTLFVHGHLHIRYTDTIRCGDDDAFTRVEGLGADVPNYTQGHAEWSPSDAWKILTLKG